MFNDSLPKLLEEDIVFIEKVGEGGYGQVWKGKWNGEGGGVVVAIKKVTYNESSPQFQEEVQKEAKILQAINHPNIVRLFGICFVPNELWIVTEFIKGRNLYLLLKGGLNDWATRIRLAHQAAISLNFLHSKEIVHRDIKSPNFMVSEDYSTLKLIDFGVSKTIRIEGTISSQHREAIGTTRWRAPETFRSSEWKTSADIYSLGLTFYEIASNKLPYEEIDNNRLSAIWPNLKRPEIPPECPEEFAQIIRECWDEDPENRPNSAQLVEKLGALVEKYPRASSEYPLFTALPLSEVRKSKIVISSAISDTEKPNYKRRSIGNKIISGTTLLESQRLRSLNGRYFFTIQEDGNIVLYDEGDGTNGFVGIWTSVTFSWIMRYKGPYRLVLDDEGQLTLYNGDGSVRWRNKKKGNKEKGPFTCEMKDSGKLVVYDSEKNDVWQCENNALVALFSPRINENKK